MSRTFQDRGEPTHHDGIAEPSPLDVLQTYRIVPLVHNSPGIVASSTSLDTDLKCMTSSFSSRPVSPRKTYLLDDDCSDQLQIRPSNGALINSIQNSQSLKETRGIATASYEINSSSWSSRSSDTYTNLSNGRSAIGTLPKDKVKTGRLLDSSQLSRIDLLNNQTIDIKNHSPICERKQSDRTRISQPRNVASRVKPHHSFHSLNTSSDHLTVKNKSHNHTTDTPGFTSLATDFGHYSSLPHRRTPGNTTRRATSPNRRHQNLKPNLVESSTPRTSNPDFFTLNPRQVPLSYPRVSTLNHADDSHYSSIEALESYSNENTTWNENAFHGVSEKIAASKNSDHLKNDATPTNIALKTHLRSKKSNHDQNTSEAFGSLPVDRSLTYEFLNINTTGFHNNENGSTSNSNRQKDSFGNLHEFPRILSRSQSLTDLQASEVLERDNNNYSDDEDGDHFGFLSYPVSFLPSSAPTAMNKAKSPTPGKRIFPKRWRSKTNALPSVSSPVAMWTPGPAGSCCWSSVSGRKVQLRPVSILSLTEAERLALQKVALVRLQNLELGCNVVIPNEMAELPRVKKSPLSLKKRSKSVSASALDTMAKEGTAVGLVFAIPLLRCVLNDRELEARRRQISAAIPTASPALLKATSDSSDNLLVFRSARKSSSSSQGSVENGSIVVSQRLDSLTVSSYRRTASCDSLSDSECGHDSNSSLIDALTLPTSQLSARPNSLPVDGSHLANQGITQVPYVVKSCFKHIETYGLQTLGIFRVGSSKKRVKQLREEFDCGKMVKLTDEHNPHDVGALLKEYFRDLPEPLLTNELYLPFLYAERLKDDQKRLSAISLLISMLPVANRDTLWALLRFLAVVSQNASDLVDDKGGIASGNKMDSHNLATLFGPNILRRTRATSDKELISESAERVEQSKEVIEVVKDMIDNHYDLFEISESLRDDVLRLLVKSSQETVDKILRSLASQNQIETDPESMGSVFEESSSSPVLYHSTNSDADLIAFVRKQTAASHRPLRITRSADDSLDSSPLNSIDPDSSLYQTSSSVSREIHTTLPSDPILQPEKFNSNHVYPSPVPNRIPIFRLQCEQENSEVMLRNRLEIGNFDRPCSDGYNQCLIIPRSLYLRENTNSSTNSVASSSRNSYGGSDNPKFGQQNLPTPPGSQAASPKQFFQTAPPSSSSTTLTASQANSQLVHVPCHSDSCRNNSPIGSTEWEKERWKYWERLATQKKTAKSEQETLV